jgi:zinc and cadmium transporter
MSPVILLTLYCALILLASLAGGWIPLMVRLTHTRMQVATSFVAGLMLGVGVLHLLPHAWHELRSIDRAAAWMLGGFLIMFFIQRFFHFHHHDVPEESPEGVKGCCDHEHEHDHGHEQAEPAHGPHHQEHTLAGKSAKHLSWGGAALGLTLHTLIDGIALAASVEVARDHPEPGMLLGFGTFLVIILHKPFDALAISTLMASGGWSKTARHLVNALFSLAIPAGVLLFNLGASQYTETGHLFVGSALAFAGGTFVCIAASDLLPELQFHAHDRGKLSVALITGLILAAAIGKFETSGHDRHVDETVGSPADNRIGAEAAPANRR